MKKNHGNQELQFLEKNYMHFGYKRYRLTMEFTDFYSIISFLALILGAIGGIPQIMRWSKPKPKLRITRFVIKERTERGFGMSIRVENVENWYRRNADATYVKAEYYIMDKSREQWGCAHNIVLTPYLVIGERISKELHDANILKVEGSPYTIVLRVTCEEGDTTKIHVIFA
jgi:hypothetical protein